MTIGEIRKMDIIYAVVGDMEKQEHFVETFFSPESYENIRMERKNNNSSLRFQSVFEEYKDAVREAKRISKPSYVKGWSYNEHRNCSFK